MGWDSLGTGVISGRTPISKDRDNLLGSDINPQHPKVKDSLP